MKNISIKILREFGLIIGLGLPIILGWLVPTLIGHSFRLWTIFPGVFCLICSILRPQILLLPYKAWMEFGNILASINSRIIFGLMFLFLLIPISFIMRLLGHDPLRKKFNDSASYRENRKQQKINFKNIF